MNSKDLEKTYDTTNNFIKLTDLVSQNMTIIAPNPNIEQGHKTTVGALLQSPFVYRIFVNPDDYALLKNLEVNDIILKISMLKEGAPTPPTATFKVLKAKKEKP